MVTTIQISQKLLAILKQKKLYNKESYEEAAIRELKEEFGIKNVELKFDFDFKYEDHKRNEVSKVYSCIYDGKIIPQEEEIDSYFFISIDKLKLMIKEEEEKFCKQRIKLLEKYFEAK